MGRESGHKLAQGVSRLPSHLSLRLLFQVQDLGRTQFLVVAGLKALTLRHSLFLILSSALPMAVCCKANKSVSAPSNSISPFCFLELCLSSPPD